MAFQGRNFVWVSLILALGITVCASAQNRGRKYKAPPPTSHIEVNVLRSYNGKPVANAAVVFRSVKDGKDEGNLEVKTNEEGKAVIDVIPTGSKVQVQVIAAGFATFAEEYQVDEADRTIEIKMVRPKAQVSLYQDNSGKAADIKPGIQEPAKVVAPPAPSTATAPPQTTPKF